MTPADRDFLADEIASLRDHLQSLANTRTNNRYIFGGYASTTPPYDNAFAFVGDTNATRFEVGDGELIQATTPGGAAFGDGTAATVDVFDNLNLLEAAVRVGSEVDMQNELERLETSVEQVITTRQRIGLQINRLDGAETVASYLNTRLPETMAELSDVDFTAAVTELKMVENALQATIATSSRLMKGTSLLDYI
jgi:flagellar hook-associated protein 3 FlgL